MQPLIDMYQLLKLSFKNDDYIYVNAVTFLLIIFHSYCLVCFHNFSCYNKHYNYFSYFKVEKIKRFYNAHRNIIPI